MPAKTVELTKAIVAALNVAEFEVDLEFDATRRVVPIDKIEELLDVRVVVFDGTIALERVTRGSYQRTYKPIVAVLQKLPAGDEASRIERSDKLHLLVEEIEAFLESQDLAGLSLSAFNEEQDSDPYNVQLLKDKGCFVSTIVLEYTDGG